MARVGYVALGEPGGAVTPATRVGGLPLLVRLARQLMRLGVTRLVLVDAEAVEDWSALLRRYQVSVEVVRSSSEELPENAVILEALALYEADGLESAFGAEPGSGAPRIRIAQPDDLREADAYLWRSIRKSMSHDGPVAYFLARPLSNLISRLLLPTGVSPNAVTLVGLAVGLASGFVAARGTYGAVLAATGLFYLGMILDCIDGDLARMKLATSRLGQWLDTLTDDLSVVLLTAGLGVGLWRVTAEPLYLWAGLGGAALVAVGQALIYRVLAQSGGPIDTAQYPWFFSDGGGLAQEGRRSLLGYLSFLFRRDSLTLAFVILAALGQAAAILALLAGGGAVYFVLLLVDRAIKAVRPKGAAA